MSQERVFFIGLAILSIFACFAFRAVYPVDVAISEARRGIAWGKSAEVADHARELAAKIQTRPAACIDIGWTLAKAGRPDAAEALFQAAWDAQPFDHRPPEALAGLYFSQHRLADVRRIFVRTTALGLALSPEGRHMHASQLIVDRDFPGAAMELEQLAREAPADARLLVELGDVSSWQQKFIAAAAFYRRANALEADPETHLKLARVLAWGAWADAHATIHRGRLAQR
jgi:tetratricopeptide (TPR) repeat protein